MENTIGSNWEFYHVAVVVRDMDKARGKYGSILGESIFRPETMLDTSAVSAYEVYGKPTSAVHKSRIGHTDIGSNKLDIEFISPVEGDPIYRDFLNKNGEGIHHIAFRVDDLDAEMDKLVAKGIPIVTSAKRSTGRGFAYFDFGDCIIELVGPVKI